MTLQVLHDFARVKPGLHYPFKKVIMLFIWFHITGGKLFQWEEESLGNKLKYAY